MTKLDVLNGVADIVDNFEAQENETLSAERQTQLTDTIATYLENVNPNHNYPPVPKS